MRKATVVVLTAAMFVPAPASATHDGEPGSAVHRCKEQLDSMGAAAFRALYGSNTNLRDAFGRCVVITVRSDRAETGEAVRNAARDCRAEAEDPDFADSHGGQTFTEFYGTNDRARGPGALRDAYGECVRMKALAERNAEIEERHDAIRNGARDCRAELRENAAAFRERYGMPRSGLADAFGRCVVTKVREGRGEDQTGGDS